jgi:hypothetical protein
VLGLLKLDTSSLKSFFSEIVESEFARFKLMSPLPKSSLLRLSSVGGNTLKNMPTPKPMINSDKGYLSRRRLKKLFMFLLG